jgi:hypothetical protein
VTRQTNTSGPAFDALLQALLNRDRGGTDTRVRCSTVESCGDTLQEPMCMQCMMTAMGATGSAAGIRSFIAAKHFSWVTPKRLKAITLALIVASLLVSALFVGGSTAKPAHNPQAVVHTH